MKENKNRISLNEYLDNLKRSSLIYLTVHSTKYYEKRFQMYIVCNLKCLLDHKNFCNNI